MSTTYDAQHMKESANPNTHADIIVLSHEDHELGEPPFPYWHACIIGIYHVMVCQRKDGSITKPERMDMLLVRWLGLDSPNGQTGWGAQRMHTVGFLPDDNTQGPPFGFLDPNAVIRMVHLIPVYDMGHTRNLLQMPSIADQSHGHEDGEFEAYYVGM